MLNAENKLRLNVSEDSNSRDKHLTLCASAEAYDELGALGLLLRNLLGLDRGGVLLAEGELRDGDVV